jgi:hypothetical protein
MPLSFSLLGVPVTLRPTAVVTGITAALVVAALVREQRALAAVSAGALWYVADCVHVAGHILSSRAVGAPMDAIDVGLYPMSVYADHDVTPQQHIGRASGGVAASLLGAIALAALARAVGKGRARQLLTIAAAQHGLLFALSMLPTRLVDGGVIYANLAKLR